MSCRSSSASILGYREDLNDRFPAPRSDLWSAWLGQERSFDQGTKSSRSTLAADYSIYV
jgi:hypothetical protein